MPSSHVRSLHRYLTGLCLGFLLLATGPARADLELRAQATFDSLLKSMPPSAGEGLVVQELPVVPILPSTIDLTAQTSNLWERIRNGFAMINLNDDLVLYYQQYYQNRPEALRRMIERSRPYLHHIVEELETRGMPTELALLPMVESSFNPMANSPAKASGLWQFIPSTGKRFNLEQNWWNDDRRDIVASTNAALDYLQTIYDMHGDWHLALASYNWGEGAVKRAIEKNEARGLPTDYPNLTMPNETRHYVPKLQALKNILGNPLTFARLGLPDIANEPYFTTFSTHRAMDVATVARLADMSLDEFRRLNPSHNRPIIKPDTAVVLPTDRVALFRRNLQSTDAPLTQWQAYAVKSTERVDQIAARFNISTSELIRANSLPGNVRLAAGSKLLVPGHGNQESLQRMLGMESSPAIIQPEPAPRGKKGKATARDGKGKGKVAAKESPAGKTKTTGSKSAASSKSTASPKPVAKKSADKKPVKRK